MLAIVLLGELVLPWRTEPDAPPGLAPRRLRPPAAPEVPAYPGILAAPVFRPDRAPGEAPGAGLSITAFSPTLQLLGVGGAPGSRTVVVKMADGGVHGLRPGQGVQGWRLLAVDPAGAVLAGPSGRVRLLVGATAGGPPRPAAAPSAASAAPASAPPEPAPETESPS